MNKNNRTLPSWLVQGQSANQEPTTKNETKKTSRKRKIAKEDNSIKRTVYCMTPNELVQYARSVIDNQENLKNDEENIMKNVNHEKLANTSILSPETNNINDARGHVGRMNDQVDANINLDSVTQEVQSALVEYPSIIDELM